MYLKQRLILVFIVLLGMMGQPVMASDIMLGPLQFRATVGSMPSSAAYVAIMNHGEIPDRLLDVTSNLARKTELHTMVMKNGVMKMRQVKDGIDIPAGKTTLLTPGGNHVMLIGLHAPLKVDVMYEITLVFQHAGKKTIEGMAMLPSNLEIADPSKMRKHKHNH